MLPTMPLLLAVKNWPDGIDATVTVGCLAVIFGIPLAGYVFMVLDYRAYLRSFKRAMVVARNYLPDLPGWIRQDTPRCLLALDLAMPCTTDDVLVAYRQKVKRLHPDRGGDRHEFLVLQRHFEQAIRFVE